MKWIGAIIILASSCYLGFHSAAQYQAEIRSLRKLQAVLEFMYCELQYRLTPLPDLCRQAAGECGGSLKKLLLHFTAELEGQIAPDVKSCMCAALSKTGGLPESTHKCMLQLGSSMGRFDLPGQLQAIESVRSTCQRYTEALEAGKDSRLQTCRTLCICAGAAMVILFV